MSQKRSKINQGDLSKTNVMFNNMSPFLTKNDAPQMRNYFSTFGEIVTATVHVSNANFAGPKTVFVEFKNEEDAAKCVQYYRDNKIPHENSGLPIAAKFSYANADPKNKKIRNREENGDRKQTMSRCIAPYSNEMPLQNQYSVPMTNPLPMGLSQPYGMPLSVGNYSTPYQNGASTSQPQFNFYQDPLLYQYAQLFSLATQQSLQQSSNLMDGSDGMNMNPGSSNSNTVDDNQSQPSSNGNNDQQNC